MSFIDAFTKIKNKVIDTDISILNGKMAIQVKLTGEDEGVFYLEANNGVLSMEPYNYFDNDATIIVDTLDLNKILDGKLDPVNAFNTGKLQIEGNIEKAIILNNLIIKNISKKEEKLKVPAKTADKTKTTAKTANRTKTGERLSLNY